MDLDSIKNQVSNISLYDVKAGWRKAQNAVMNYTEMEAKVREATNNEPWGTSTSLMMEIATGTFNYSTLGEIMSLIYKRFTEKSAEEWRQIYKALQLLEFLIKNGSERVIDDARSHLSLLKMLRQFHYVDLNGKDQGINVRNRAKELAELLGDVDRIRQERKKARATRNKYGGSEGGISSSSGMSGGSRYGGFGSETGGSAGGANYGGYSGGVYGDGGGFGGRSTADEYDTAQSRRDRFDEYDEHDDGGATTSSARRKADSRTTASKPEPPKPKSPEVDLFDFGDDDVLSSGVTAPSTSNGKAPAAPVPATNVLDDFGQLNSTTGGGDDDFDEFQGAPSAPASAAPAPALNPAFSIPMAASNSKATSSSSSVQFSAVPPPPASAASNNTSTINYSAFKNQPPSSTPAQLQPSSNPLSPTNQSQNQPRPTTYQPTGPNYFGSISVAQPAAASGPSSTAQQNTTNTGLNAGNKIAPQAKKPASGADPFASLALGGAGGKKAAGAQKGPTMADMAKQKATQGIWGPAAGGQQQQGGGSNGGLI